MLRTKNTKSLLRSLLAIGAAGAIAGFGTFSAFSSTTENPGNQIDTGTVALSDNDTNTALYDVSNSGPGAIVDRCITVTYTGDMNSDVKLYLPETVTPLGQYVNLTITPGTDLSPSFGDCTGFAPDPAALYSNTLAAFRAAHNSWANGLVDDPEGKSEWSQGDTVTYRFQLTVQDDNNAQGKATGTHRLVWEARNQ